MEIDEVCVQFSPSLWLWLIVSRQVGQVLGLIFGDRSDAMLAQAWDDVPPDWRSRPVFTDHWEAYARFFPASQHTACDKGSGLTSHIEAWNTKSVTFGDMGASAKVDLFAKVAGYVRAS